MTIDHHRQEQDRLAAEILRLMQSASGAPNPAIARDPEWGRSSVTVTFLLDEFDPAQLAQCLPRITSLHSQFRESRRQETSLQKELADRSVTLQHL